MLHLSLSIGCPGYNFFAYEIVPVHQAASLSFSDTDGDTGYLSGSFIVGAAVNDTDITAYNLYWGEYQPLNDTISHISLISSLTKGGSLTHTFNHQSVPDLATHLRVVSMNQFGEMESGVELVLVDRKSR